MLIDLIGRHRLPIDIFTLDTGLLFPETYDLWRRLEARYDLRIRSVTPELSVEGQAAVHGDRLWERQPEHCCGMRKVVPLKAELARVDAWITAIRRDQTPQRAGALVVEPDAKFGIVKVNPLVRWTKRHVWAHILEHDVPYNPLHDNGYPSIGCAPCTSAVKPGEDERAGRWRGTAQDRMRGCMDPRCRRRRPRRRRPTEDPQQALRRFFHGTVSNRPAVFVLLIPQVLPISGGVIQWAAPCILRRSASSATSSGIRAFRGPRRPTR